MVRTEKIKTIKPIFHILKITAKHCIAKQRDVLTLYCSPYLSTCIPLVAKLSQLQYLMILIELFVSKYKHCLPIGEPITKVLTLPVVS